MTYPETTTQLPSHPVQAETSHEPTLFAEPIFQWGPLTVTNSLLNSWIVVAGLIVLSVMIRRKIETIPRGLQNFFEYILDGAFNLADSVTGSRQKTMRFMPVILPLFFFILLNNWLGIFPGVGTIGFYTVEDGTRVFVPLLRGATADLNTTLGLALAAVILTHVFGVLMTSTWRHLNRFIGIELIISLPKKIFKEKKFTALFLHPIQFFVGLIEIISEVSKVASLSFRLFGNIFAGEVLLAAMAAIFAYVLPIPFMFLEIIVGLIQALIFSMLTLVFMTVMSESHSHDQEPGPAYH